ncbi:zinc finger protein 2-like [Ostrinia nubilalis]|uniref:zinc finger protein 2-like n=1 Tax=Ostrinia nubilalis TaxID=29057 RepID=UPI0030823175
MCNAILQDPDSEDDDPDALQVCRICLAVDCKMFSIRKFKLEQSFENLTGSEVNKEDKFPQKLCYICFRRLVNCARLRAQSLKAECLMMEIMRKQDLTYENIKAINREKNLLTPNLAPKQFESNHYDLFLEDDRTKEINFDNTFSNEVFLEEFDARMETDMNESADGYSSDDSLPLEVSKRKKEMEESEKMKAGDDDKRKGDELKCLVCAQSFKEEFDYYSHVANHTEHPVVVTENQITIEFDRKYYEPNVEENDTKDDELEELSLVIDTERKGDDDLKLEQILDDYVASEKDYSSDESTLQEVKKKKEQKKLKKKPQKNKEPKIDRRRKPFLSDDLNETLFTIIDLTYEEQVAEIEKRQESSNFKNAVFKCMECYKGFLDEDAYNSHMLRHTDECGVHRCDVCKTHFRHPHALRKHITAHHTQRFSCKQCPYVTAHRQSARLHERWHKGTKYACPHCPDEFLKFTTYMGHIRIKHPSDFVCQLCGYSFVSEKGIALHKKLKHRQENTQIPEDGPTCDLCNIRFVDTDAYKRHISVSARHNPVDKGESNTVFPKVGNNAPLWALQA